MSEVYTFETHEDARKQLQEYGMANMAPSGKLKELVHGCRQNPAPANIGMGLEFICAIELTSLNEKGKPRAYEFGKEIPGMYMESVDRKYKSIPELAGAVKNWLKNGRGKKVVSEAKLKPVVYTVKKQLWQVLGGDEPEETRIDSEWVLERVKPKGFLYPGSLNQAEIEEFKKAFFTE